MAFAEFDQHLAEFFEVLQVPDPEQLLLEGVEETLDVAVALRPPDECWRGFRAEKADLILETVAHELGSVIMPELQTAGGPSLKAEVELS